MVLPSLKPASFPPWTWTTGGWRLGGSTRLALALFLPKGSARFQRQSGECAAQQRRASAQQFSAIHLLHDFSFGCG